VAPSPAFHLFELGYNLYGEGGGLYTAVTSSCLSFLLTLALAVYNFLISNVSIKLFRLVPFLTAGTGAAAQVYPWSVPEPLVCVPLPRHSLRTRGWRLSPGHGCTGQLISNTVNR
jgi:hypothetical protein